LTAAIAFLYIMPGSHPRYDLLHTRLIRFVRTLDGVEKGTTRGIHQARVSSRRLREVVPVLQLDGKDARHLARRLRKITRRLGTVRELDVLALLLEELGKSGRYEQRALTRLAAAIAGERAHAHERLPARLPVAKLRRLSGKLARIADDLAGQKMSAAATRGWRWAIDARAAHRAAAVKASIEAAGPVYLPDRVHAVRIALKKLRYAIELESEVAPDPYWSGELAALKRSQELLGRLRDRQVLIERTRQVQASLTPPDLVVWRGLGNLVTAVETECRQLHARYLRHSTDLVALCDRVVGRAPAPTRARRAG
jgi:CHAD domain-containing protein